MRDGARWSAYRSDRSSSSRANGGARAAGSGAGRSSKMIVSSEKPNMEMARTAASPCNPVESGYVTWSSTSCGLRPIQSA